MSIINIISNNVCELNLNVTGIFNVSLISVSGKFNPVILNVDDFITFLIEDKSYDMYINDVISKGDITTHLEYLNSIFISWYVDKFGKNPSNQFEVDGLNGIIHFPLTIKYCTERFKNLLGIIDLSKSGLEMGQVNYNDNGPSFFMIKCDKLNSPMRFSHQTCAQMCPKTEGQNIYPAITNTVSLNLNNFSLSYPFQLQGNSFILSSKDLVGLKFSITDINGEDVEFMNEILWTFQIEKIGNEVMNDVVNEVVTN